MGDRRLCQRLLLKGILERFGVPVLNSGQAPGMERPYRLNETKEAREVFH